MNKIDKKQYIGQTIRSINTRWKQHVYDAKALRNNSYLYQAIRKYGAEKFVIKELATADTIEELNELEIKYIKEYNTLVPKGYNLDSGGRNKKLHSITKGRISKALMGNQNSKNHKHTEEARQRMSASNSGVPKSAKHRQSLSEAHLGQQAWNKGIPFSQDTKNKMSLSKLGKTLPDKTKERMKSSQIKRRLREKQLSSLIIE